MTNDKYTKSIMKIDFFDVKTLTVKKTETWEVGDMFVDVHVENQILWLIYEKDETGFWFKPIGSTNGLIYSHDDRPRKVYFTDEVYRVYFV